MSQARDKLQKTAATVPSNNMKWCSLPHNRTNSFKMTDVSMSFLALLKPQLKGELNSTGITLRWR